MLSALQHPDVVGKYLSVEQEAGRIIEVMSEEAARLQGIHCSPFGVIPKKNKPNHWRLIVDLSAPDGHSVNDKISKELVLMAYVSMNDLVTGILE